jgi:hypothetical protein
VQRAYLGYSDEGGAHADDTRTDLQPIEATATIPAVRA